MNRVIGRQRIFPAQTSDTAAYERRGRMPMGASRASLTGRGSRSHATGRRPLFVPSSSLPDSSTASDPDYFVRKTTIVALKHKTR